ncbi:MAG: hypothetical protein IE909_09760 [Campylobacterales bacterium]|nr:hypothetical protein [Campylobacterales bacterium]
MESLLDYATDNETKQQPQIYLLQIHRIKLQDYIQCGLVAPDRYLGSEAEIDIQSKNRDFLVVSDGYIDKLDNAQILLELEFTEEEKTRFHSVGELFFFDFPIPITRIKKIYIKDDKPEHIVANVENSEKGFVHEGLFSTIKKKKNEVSFLRKEYKPLRSSIKTSGYEENITKFDKKLGMFAFMKNANIYYANKTGCISNFSDHYFLLLSRYAQISHEAKHFEDFEKVRTSKEFFGLLLSNEQINEEFVEKIAQKIEELELKQIFLEILKPNGTKQVLPKLLEQKNIILYLVALVYYFRQKDSNKKDNFKLEIGDLIPFEVAEISLAVLGIYLGYNRLRSSEKVEIKDKTFKKIFGEKFDIKFRLDSELDYVTIEALYNNCFHGATRSNINVSNIDFKDKTFKIPKDKNFNRWYIVSSQESILGIPYIKICKKSDIKIATEFLDKYPLEITSSKYGILVGYVLQKFPDLICVQQNNKMVTLSLKKSALLERLKANPNSINKNIFDVFELDSKR